MDYKNITTTEKLNETVKDTLKMRGDNMSLYALKRIEELEKQCNMHVVSQQRELLITALNEANRTGYIRLFTKADAIADKVISGNL